MVASNVIGYKGILKRLIPLEVVVLVVDVYGRINVKFIL